MKKSVWMLLTLFLLATLLSAGSAWARSYNGQGGDKSLGKKAESSQSSSDNNGKSSNDTVQSGKNNGQGNSGSSDNANGQNSTSNVANSYDNGPGGNAPNGFCDTKRHGAADVPSWAQEAAARASYKGIIKLNRFHSAVQCSRAQTAVMLAKALGLEPEETSEIPFQDGVLISPEDIGYIMALYRKGIIVGSSNGNFNPNSAVTRAQMACMLEQALKDQEQEPDVDYVSLPQVAQVEAGQSITLTAVVKYADGTSDNKATWTSSDMTLATVENGVVTAAAGKTGTVTITATATGDTTKSASCVVTVVASSPDNR